MQGTILNKRTATAAQARNAVYVGRPTVYGNPFSVQEFGRAGAVEKYRQWIIAPAQAPLRQQMRRKLRGENLLCYCAPLRCHAEYIRFIANTEADPA